MRVIFIPLILFFIYTQTAQAFWIGAAVRGAKNIKSKLTESKPIEPNIVESKGNL